MKKGKTITNNNGEMCHGVCAYCPMSEEGKDLFGCKLEQMVGRCTHSKK